MSLAHAHSPWNTLGRFVCWLGAVGVAEKIKRHKKKIFFAACHDGLASVQTNSESVGLSLLTCVTSALVSSFTCLNQTPCFSHSFSPLI